MNFIKSRYFLPAVILLLVVGLILPRPSLRVESIAFDPYSDYILIGSSIIDHTSHNNEKTLTQDRPTEVYHYANLGRASWFEFAQEVFELLNIRCDVKAILTSQYPTLAKRPKNTVMNINKIVQEFGVEVVDWRDRLNIIKELLKESV